MPVPKESGGAKVTMAAVLPASSPAGRSPAPQKWVAHADPSTGNVYYFNADTGETTWDMPMEMTPASVGQKELPGNAERTVRSRPF